MKRTTAIQSATPTESSASLDALASVRLLTMRDVCARITLHRGTIYRLIRAGTFPPPIQISPGRVAFRERDVERYAANCRAGVTARVIARLGVPPSPENGSADVRPTRKRTRAR